MGSGSGTFTVTATYDDGTTDDYTTAASLSDGYLYEFNCNPGDLGITMDDGSKRVEFFDVEIDGYSDSRRFTVDWRYCERPFYLLFANSIGGIDDVYLGGKAVEGLKVDGKVMYKPADIDATVYDPTLIKPNSSGQNVWKINTGWKTVTQMLHLRDLLVSRQVWLLYPNEGLTSYSVIPVNIDNSSAELVDREKNTYSLTLEISEAHTSQYSFDNRLY